MIDVGALIGGRFRVDHVLGAGGMGVVVAATHVELGQQVALKVLHDELAANPQIVARFLREARAVAQLRTDHVCRVYDVGRLDSGAPFIVMERLHGSDLGGVVARGPVAMTTAVEYVIQACVALAEAHAAGVVHRDLKPANLFVVRRPDGGPHVKVLDFGIAKAATAAEAKLTHTTSTMGSPGYMSPEQIRSTRDVDLRTDIWALGVTLYQLLSGRMPFPGTQLAEIAVTVMTAPPAPFEVDERLRAIVMRCLEKEPERRYASVAELAVALLPFGGPSAPRFVAEITRGAVAPMPAPIVAVTAPTAASLIGPHTGAPPPTAATGMQAAPPLAPSAPHLTQAAPRSSTRWVVLGGVLVIVLVGGGALAGYLARGGDAEAARDAGAIATGDAGGRDAAAHAGVVDGSSGSAGDPWNGEHDAAVLAEEPHDPTGHDIPGLDEESAKIRAEALKQTKASMAPYREQNLAALRMAEGQLEQIKRYSPESYEQIMSSYTSAACMFDDAKLAQRFFDRISNAALRAEAQQQCTMFGYAMATKKP